ncbi:MAG: hypothetical protein JWL95_1672, partial [Gemmatimonadetes bacterium]|nr:hypothetical protein [Gemmatimonadota bacterium]
LQVAQSISGRFGGSVGDAWAWLLPNLMPTSSLIVTVLVLEARGGTSDERAIDPFLYRLTMGLCAGYLLLVLATILGQPLSGTPVLTAMKQSNLWLGPVQGLASGALGAFFFQGERDETPKES